MWLLNNLQVARGALQEKVSLLVVRKIFDKLLQVGDVLSMNC